MEQGQVCVRGEGQGGVRISVLSLNTTYKVQESTAVPSVDRSGRGRMPPANCSRKPVCFGADPPPEQHKGGMYRSSNVGRNTVLGFNSPQLDVAVKD